MKKIGFLSIFALILLAISPAYAQSAASAAAALFGPPKKEDAAPAAPEIPKDELGRENPRGTLSGFLSAIGKGDYEKAGQFLDLSYLSNYQAAAQAPTLAKDLEALMNNGWITPASMVSNDPLGKVDDGLSDGVEKLGSLKAKDKTTDLLATKTTSEAGATIWLISADTMRQVPTLYKNLSASWIDRVLPDSLLDPKLGGVPVGHWVAMLGIAGLAYILSWGIVFCLAHCTRKCWKNKDVTSQKHFIDAFQLPVTLYLGTWIFVASCIQIGISVVARQYLSHVTIVVGWVSLALLFWKLIDVIAEASQKKLILKGKYGALSGVQFFRRMAKFIFIAVVLFVSLDTVGIDVTAGLAALGIGGLALAFGAQKTIENFIGSIMVIFDQPVRIGDFCKVGEIEGTIEDIGMRSTRIRTLNRTLITIPNGDFSAQRIENYAHRDQFRIHHKMALRLDITPDQLRYLIVEIRSLLYSHPRIDSKSANVKFIGWNEYSAILEIAAYVITRNNDDFMEVREDIYLRILDIVVACGATLTTPATPFSQFTSPEETKLANRTTAEQKIHDMNARGDLPLPKFDPKKIDSLKGSTDYPAKGSSSYKGKKE